MSGYALRTEKQLGARAKALGTYGTAAENALPELRDLLRNPAETDYVKRSVTTAGLAIKTALLIAARATVRSCRRRCGKIVAPDEYARSQRFFQRALCDVCFDQTATERRFTPHVSRPFVWH